MESKRLKFKERLRRKRLGTSLTAGLVGALAFSASGQVFEFKTANPLTGVVGNDISNPTFVDIDQDGDQDLFLGGNSSGNAATARENALLLFENVNGAWVQKNSPFQDDLGIQSILDTAAVDVSPQFVDFDGDGDLDAFLGLSTGGVKYYENDAGNLTLVSDESDPFSDLEFEEGRLDIAAGDINNDGSTQLIITDGGSHTVYGLVDGKFVAESDLGFDDSSTGTLHDIDEDGDLDFIVGNKYGAIIFYENVDGVLTENDDDNPLGEFDFSEYINPAFADVDADGEVDLVLGNSYGDLFFFKNTAEGYKHISQNIQGISTNGETESNPEFVDFDGDGDQDLFIGTDNGLVQFHENINGRFTLNEEKNPFQNIDNSISSSTPSFGDIDGDGDMDCIIGDYSEPPFYYENVDGVYTQIDSIDSPFAVVETGDALKPCLEDFDGDGDMDLFVGNKYGEITYYENVDGVYQQATLENLTGRDFGGYSVPTFGDVDSDGDRDMLVGNSAGEITILYNNEGTLEEDGSGTNPLDFTSILSGQAAPELGDIDGDGDMDLLVGSSNGDVYFFQNQALSSSVATLVLDGGVLLSPNPAQNFLNVEVPWKVDFVDVQVVSQNGQRVLSSRESSNNFKINTQNLTPGYYALILTGDQYLTTKKFIKID